MLHVSQRDMVRASLDSTHHPDCYPVRASSRSRQLRVADGNTGRETPPAESVVTHGARLEEPGSRPGSRAPQSPTRCAACGRRWGLHTTDRYMNGQSSWAGDTCPSCVWDAECEAAEAEPSRMLSEFPELRAVPGTGGRRHV